MPVTPELTQYVVQARASGLADDAIRAELLKAGWNPADVDAVVPPSVPLPPMPVLQPAFKQVPPVISQPVVKAETPQFQGGPVSEAKPPVGQAVGPKKHSRTPFISSVIFLLVAGGAIYYFLPNIVGLYMKFTAPKVSALPMQNTSADTMQVNSVAPIGTSTDIHGPLLSEDGKFSVTLDMNKVLTLHNADGLVMKTFSPQEQFCEIDCGVDRLVWYRHDLWEVLGEPGGIGGFIKIDAETFKLEFYAFPIYNASGETALNPAASEVAYSDRPHSYDTDSEEEFERSGKVVTLYVYSFKNQTKEVIATSSTKRFAPKWFDDKTLEYNDPVSGERIRAISP